MLLYAKLYCTLHAQNCHLSKLRHPKRTSYVYGTATIEQHLRKLSIGTRTRKHNQNQTVQVFLGEARVSASLGALSLRFLQAVIPPLVVDGKVSRWRPVSIMEGLLE